MALGILGALTAVAGILIASQIGSGTGTTATWMLLDPNAAVLSGGTALSGGKGGHLGCSLRAASRME